MYLDLLFHSSFNLSDMSFNNFYDTLNSIIALICFAFIILFTVFIVLVNIFANKEVSEDDIRKSKIRALYENMKKNKSFMTTHLVFVLYRIMIVTIVLSLHKNGVLQINLFILVIIAVIVFKIIFEPYKTKLMNLQDIIGHFLILGLWIMYFNLVDKSTEFATSGKGYIIGVICLTIIATLIFYFYLFLIIALIHSRKNKRKVSKSK